MKFRIIKTVEVETEFGPHEFEVGDIVLLDSEEAYPLVKYGYAVPIHGRDIARKLSKMQSEDISTLNEVVTLFAGRIIEVKLPQEPFDTSQCNLQPSPYGECHDFKMYLDKTDNTLSPFCLKGKVFCPHAVSRKGVMNLLAIEKEKPSEDGLDSVCLKVQQS